MRRHPAAPTRVSLHRLAVMREARAAQRDSDLKTVLSTPEGRRILWWLLDDVCGLYGPSYTPEAAHTAYREGRRSIAMDVLREARRVAPTSYVTALQEALTSALEAEVQREAEESSSADRTSEDA